MCTHAHTFARTHALAHAGIRSSAVISNFNTNIFACVQNLWVPLRIQNKDKSVLRQLMMMLNIKGIS